MAAPRMQQPKETQSNAEKMWRKIHLFMGYTKIFHFMLFLLSKSVFYGVQKLKGKHVFRKIEIIHAWHIVSSVAQKRNSVDFSNSSCK